MPASELFEFSSRTDVTTYFQQMNVIMTKGGGITHNSEHKENISKSIIWSIIWIDYLIIEICIRKHK